MAIQGKFMYYGDDLSTVLNIRNKVFGYNDNNYNDMDVYDSQSIQVIVFSTEDNRAVATGRIVFDGETYSISKVAVLEEERGNYYGDFAVRMLAAKGFMSGASGIYLQSTKEMIPFFQKIGFVIDNDNYSTNIVSMKLVNENLCGNCNNIKL